MREAIKQDVIATVKKFHTEKEIEMDSIIDDDDDDEFDDTESVIFE